MRTPPLWKTKTFWGGVATVATGVGIAGAGDLATGGQTIMIGILAIFGRDAVRKVQ